MYPPHPSLVTMNTERWARVVTLHQWQSTSLGLKVVVQTVTQCCSTLGIVKFAMVKIGESRTRLKLSPHWPEFVLPVLILILLFYFSAYLIQSEIPTSPAPLEAFTQFWAGDSDLWMTTAYIDLC